jgi:glycosyltransferase involved in cell wall biosynthesis
MRSRELIFISTARGRGGGEHFAIELLRELASRGWSITLVCPPATPLFLEDSLNQLTGRTGIDLSAKVRQPLRFIAALFQWMQFVRRLDTAPLLYGNGYETLKWIAAAKRIRKAIAVCHLHDSVFEYYKSARARNLSRHVDRFFAISETVRTAFHRGAHVALDRIALIPNGLPPSSTTEEEGGKIRAMIGLPESGPLIVMVARTDPFKGHETLLRAVPAVLARHPGAVFVFIGIEERSPVEKELVAKWRGLLGENGAGPAVRFEPYRPDARRFMRAADLVVVPSTAEGFGRTAVEAMAEGTPVIASRVGGLAEIVDSGVNGLLVPPGDAAALAAAINGLLDDPGMRRRLAHAGSRCAEDLYSTRMMVDRIEGELLRLANRDGNSATPPA